MKKFISWAAIALALAITGCASAPKDAGAAPDVYRALARGSATQYEVWMNGVPGQYFVFYYSDKNDFNRVPAYQDAIATEKKHLIHYRNKTSFRYLKAVLISAYFTGNPNSPFSVSVQDKKGNELFQSDAHRFGEFSEANGATGFVEIPVNLADAPKEIYIVVESNSTKENALFIRNIPTSGKIFSIILDDRFHYQWYNGRNAAIFPRFQKNE